MLRNGSRRGKARRYDHTSKDVKTVAQNKLYLTYLFSPKRAVAFLGIKPTPCDLLTFTDVNDVYASEREDLVTNAFLLVGCWDSTTQHMGTFSSRLYTLEEFLNLEKRVTAWCFPDEK